MPAPNAFAMLLRVRVVKISSIHRNSCSFCVLSLSRRTAFFKSASRVWPALTISLPYRKNNTTQIMPRNNDVSKRRLKHVAILYNPRRHFRKKLKKKLSGVFSPDNFTQRHYLYRRYQPTSHHHHPVNNLHRHQR